MLKYIFKRILIFIPTLIIISLVIFALSKIAPGDPVELKLQGGLSTGDTGQLADKQAGENQYFEVASEMGLDLPVFYAGISSKCQSDTLYKIGRRFEREMLSKVSSRYGSWQNTSDYYHALKSLEYATYSIEKNSYTYGPLRSIRETVNELYRETDEAVINSKLDVINKAVNSVQEVAIDSSLFIYDENGNALQTTKTEQLLLPLKGDISKTQNNFAKLQSEASWISKYIPKFSWYGFNNQYHRWLAGNKPWVGSTDDPTKTHGGFIRADFGKSYIDGRPVWSTIKDGLVITIGFNLVALFLIYLISIPLGVYNAVKKDTTFDRVSTVGLFVLYSLPSFWIATLLIVFLTNSEYGMDFFPSFGLGTNKIDEGMGLFERLGIRLHHFILPIFCMTYGGLAFISRQMRGGVLDVFKQDYIRTARAKGLSENVIIWKHAFRNSLIPIITIFASLFPAMIGGSLILEIIFSIPGMGQLAFNALLSRDYPILFAVLMLGSILTLVGILISDILYTVVDPRISFTKKS